MFLYHSSYNNFSSRVELGKYNVLYIKTWNKS